MQKSSNGFHSKGLSVSDFSLFTSVAEQKLRTRKQAWSPHIVFEDPRNLLLLVRKEANSLWKSYNDYLNVLRVLHFQSISTSTFLMNVPNYFEMQMMLVYYFKRWEY